MNSSTKWRNFLYRLMQLGHNCLKHAQTLVGYFSTVKLSWVAEPMHVETLHNSSWVELSLLDVSYVHCRTNNVRSTHCRKTSQRQSGTLSSSLSRLFNTSLTHGIFPSSFQTACITPLLNGADLDPTDVMAYRPISNLSVTSKLYWNDSSASSSYLTYLNN